MITGLDHVNLRTTRLEDMIAWYERFLGLRTGPRPPFRFPGAWLYAGDSPVVHLVPVAREPERTDDLALEHAAFRATDFRRFLKTLVDHDEPFRLAKVPEFPIVQVNLWDPDGNHLHVDFDAAEADGIDIAAFAGSGVRA